MSNKTQTGPLVSDNVLECTAKWKIPNFRDRCNNNERKLTSPLFPLVSAQDNIEWQLSLYPDKYFMYQGRRRDCVGVYLDAHCDEREVRFTLVSAELCLLNNEGEEVEKKYLKRHNVISGQDNHLGIANFIPWRVLLARQQDLLPRGDITVMCRIRTKFGLSNLRDFRATNSSAMSSTLSLASTEGAACSYSEQKCAEWSKSHSSDESGDEDSGVVSTAGEDNYASELTSRLLDTGIGADVVITCCGKRFNCHRNILAAKSPVFLKMFGQDIKPVTLDLGDDMTPMAVEDLLSYFYTGRAPHLSDNSLLLFAAASEYEVPELREMAKREVVSKLTPDTAVDLLIFAQKSGEKELKKLAAEYIANS